MDGFLRLARPAGSAAGLLALLLALLMIFDHDSMPVKQEEQPPILVPRWPQAVSFRNSTLGGVMRIMADDGTCSADSPCENEACCGPSGFCGYCK